MNAVGKKVKLLIVETVLDLRPYLLVTEAQQKKARTFRLPKEQKKVAQSKYVEIYPSLGGAYAVLGKGLTKYKVNAYKGPNGRAYSVNRKIVALLNKDLWKFLRGEAPFLGGFLPHHFSYTLPYKFQVRNNREPLEARLGGKDHFCTTVLERYAAAGCAFDAKFLRCASVSCLEQLQLLLLWSEVQLASQGAVSLRGSRTAKAEFYADIAGLLCAGIREP